MLDDDVAADRRQGGSRRIEGRLRRGIQDIAEALHRQARLVEILPHLRQAQYGCGQPSGQHVEGD
jgi:hypothetical protein